MSTIKLSHEDFVCLDHDSNVYVATHVTVNYYSIDPYKSTKVSIEGKKRTRRSSNTVLTHYEWDQFLSEIDNPVQYNKYLKSHVAQIVPDLKNLNWIIITESDYTLLIFIVRH